MHVHLLFGGGEVKEVVSSTTDTRTIFGRCRMLHQWASSTYCPLIIDNGTTHDGASTVTSKDLTSSVEQPVAGDTWIDSVSGAH